MSQKGGKMNVNDVIQLISSVGFPIICCLICFYYIDKKDTSHREEIDSLRNVIEQNTIVTEKLVSALEGREKI